MARYEWAIVEVIVLIWLVWGLVATRLSIRRDRRKAQDSAIGQSSSGQARKAE